MNGKLDVIIVVVISFLAWLTRLVITSEQITAKRWLVRLFVSFVIGLLIYVSVPESFNYGYPLVAFCSLISEDVVLAAMKIGGAIRQDPASFYAKLRGNKK